MKEGASNCVERHLTIATLPFYGHILKWGVSVVFIANALRRTPRVCVIPFFFFFFFFFFLSVEKYYIYIDSIQMIKGNDKEKCYNK